MRQRRLLGVGLSIAVLALLSATGALPFELTRIPATPPQC